MAQYSAISNPTHQGVVTIGSGGLVASRAGEVFIVHVVPELVLHDDRELVRPHVEISAGNYIEVFSGPGGGKSSDLMEYIQEPSRCQEGYDGHDPTWEEEYKVVLDFSFYCIID